MSILQLVASCSPLTWSCPSLTAPAEAAPAARPGRLWVDPVRLLEVTHAPQLGQWALATAQRFSPRALPSPSRAGRPRVYTDLSVLLTSLVAAAWHWSYEDITAALAQDARLAHALGYPTTPRRTISPAQYSRRVRALGLVPYLLFFVALVWTLLRLGVIHGWDVIIDSSYLDAWYKHDPDADWNAATTSSRAQRFGYKIHSLICRWSYLPLLFVITPANVADSVMAIPLVGRRGALVRLAGAVRAGGRRLLHLCLPGVHPRRVARLPGGGLQPAPSGQPFPGHAVLPASVAAGAAASEHHRAPLRLPQALLGLGRVPSQRLGGRLSVCLGGAYRPVTGGAGRDPTGPSRFDHLPQSGLGLRHRLNYERLSCDCAKLTLGSAVAELLERPALGDAFSIVLRAGHGERMRFLAAKGVDAARVRAMRGLLGRPEEDEGDEEVTIFMPPRGAGTAGTSPAGEGQRQGRDGQRGGGDGRREGGSRRDGESTLRREQPTLPPLDVDRLAVVDVHDGRLHLHGSGGQGTGGSRGGGGGSRHPDWEAMEAMRRLYGRRGEEAVYEAERNRLRAEGRDPECVRWISRDDEPADHDLESLDSDGEAIYIEVESTTSADPGEPFPISSDQLRFAAQHRSHYFIYRVTQVREPAPTITRYRDPIGLWQEGKAETEVAQARMWLAQQEQEDGTVSAAASTEAH